MLRRQRELEEREAEMLRRYTEQQQAREHEILEKKAEVEAVRDAIFQRLKYEEERRQSEKEYVENLRNELSWQEFEEQARIREQ